MFPRWPELLEQIFLNSAAELRQFLSNWSVTERKSCFQKHKADLNTLRKICHYSEHSYLMLEGNLPFGWNSRAQPRIANVRTLWPQVKAQLDHLSEWIAAEQINVYAAEDMYLFALNLEVAWAALCDSRSGLALSKAQRKAPPLPYTLLQDKWGNPLPTVPETILEAQTLTLLDRTEDWILPALEKAFADYQPQYPGLGLYTSVSHVFSARPEWQSSLALALGKAVFLELHLWRQKLADLPLEHLLAGLAWRNLATEGPLRGEPFPVQVDPQVLGAYLRQIWPPDEPLYAEQRARLLDLILTRLCEHSRKEENRNWLKLWDALEPSVAERAARQAIWLQLLQATTPNAIQLGLKECKALLPDWVPDALLIESLASLLSQPVQKLGKESLGMLKALAKRAPEWQRSILIAVLPQLTTPHAALRHDLLQWFKGQSLPPEVLSELAQLQDSGLLTPLETAALQELLPAQPVPVKAVAEQHSHSAQVILVQAFPTRQVRPTDTAQDPRLTLPEDAEALVEMVLPALQQAPSEILLEQMAQAILSVPPPLEPQRIKRQWDPLLRHLEDLQKHQHPGFFRHSGQVLLALLLQAWLGEPSTVLTEAHWQVLASGMPLSVARVREALLAHSLGASACLAQPESLTGWLTGPVFLKRLAELPESLLTETAVFHAMLRLAPGSMEEYSKSHEAVFERCLGDGSLWLKMAFAPEKIALTLLDQTHRRFSKHPPNDVLLEPLFVQTTEIECDSISNRHFRGVMAALGYRQRSGRFTPALQSLVNAWPWDVLRLNLGLDYGLLTPSTSGTDQEPLPILQEFLDGFNNHVKTIFQGLFESEKSESPAAIEPALSPWLESLQQPLKKRPLVLKTLAELDPRLKAQIQACLLGTAKWDTPPDFELPGQMRQLEVYPAHWPQLWPLLLWLNPGYNPFYGIPLEPHRHLYPRLSLSPAQAQDLFDVAVLKLQRSQGVFGGLSRAAFREYQQEYWQKSAKEQKLSPLYTADVRPEIEKHDFCLLLLQIGQLPRIDLSRALPALAGTLLLKHPEQRQPVLELLWTGLCDGRILAEPLAQALAEIWRTQSMGLRYFLEALQFFELQGEAGCALLLRTLEYLLAAPLAAIPAKNLSAALDLALHLVQDDISLLDPAACRGLENLALSPKKSLVRDKAQILLRRLPAPA